MANERRNGAGSLASGVLEKITPHEGDDSAEYPADPAKGRAVARRAKAGSTGSARQDVKGRTIYLPESLFERIMVQAHRKKRTISEYVAAILERQVPDYRTAGRAEADDAA